VILLRDRAFSTTELADKLGLPKGTVGHHMKVLEKAGLIQVVRTRQVRAMTEKVYGRSARLFLFESTDANGEDVRNVAAATLRRAAEEMLPLVEDGRTTFAVVRANLTDADARRLSRRLEKLVDDFRAADTPDGQNAYGMAAAIYPRALDA
jgi:predicted ArsR family transcriptional regulator